jgi:hypothetical protein
VIHQSSKNSQPKLPQLSFAFLVVNSPSYFSNIP